MKTTLVAVIQQLRTRALDLASDLDAVAAEVVRERALLEGLTVQLQEVLSGAAGPAASPGPADADCNAGAPAVTEPAPAPVAPPAPPPPPAPRTPTATPAPRPAPIARPVFRRLEGKKQGTELIWLFLERYDGPALTTAQIAQRTGVNREAANQSLRGLRRRGFISGDGHGWSIATRSSPAPATSTPPAQEQPARATKRGGASGQANTGGGVNPPAPPPVEVSDDDPPPAEDFPEDEPPPHMRPGAALELLEQDEDLEEQDDEAEDDEPAAKPRGLRLARRPPSRQEQRDNDARQRAGRPLIPEGHDGPPVREMRTKVAINKQEQRW